MKNYIYYIISIFILISCGEPYKATHLTCDYKTNPIALENANPRLSWRVESDDRGFEQYAYQIIVAESKDALNREDGHIWNSGKVISHNSVQVPYEGELLLPKKCYYWRVKVWRDKDQEEGVWSSPSFWRQVAPNPSMSWIGYKDKGDRNDYVSSVWFRKNIDITEIPNEDIFADISTTGYYELYINGKKVGDDVLSPSVSGMDKRTFYVTYNIKDYLKKGVNTIGIWVARGWNGTDVIPVAFNCEIAQNNNLLEVKSDTSWRASTSHYATIGEWRWGNFGGELIDANRSVKDWNLQSCDDSSWSKVSPLDSPSPIIVAQPCELNRESDPIAAQKITSLDNGCYEIDFGRALTGNYKVEFPKMAKGDSVTLYFGDVKWSYEGGAETPAGTIGVSPFGAEILFSSGGEPCRYTSFKQKSIYVASGESGELFESKFNPLAFRYIIVEGLKEAPLTASAALVETDLNAVGSFECSDTLLMNMHTVNDWTMRCLNQGGVYVDCPHRERLGYGDGQVSVESSIVNYYMPQFYRKFVSDWALRQDSIGMIPNVAPIGQGGGGPAWPGLLAAITWRNYLYYGDIALLEELYPTMSRYLESLEFKCEDNILRKYGDEWSSIGDWLAPNRGMDGSNWPNVRMSEFFNNCYRVYLWDINRKAALALGRKEDAEYCKEKIDIIRPLIHQEFYDEVNQCYPSEEQPYLVMPLMAGVVPDSLKEDIWSRLESRIVEKSVVETGMLGTYFLINYLSDLGRDDLLYRLVAHENYPGWGYMLSQGATVWWEQWNGYYSHMHSVFTSLDSWFYQGIAGIKIKDEQSGMRNFAIKPAFDLPINYVSAKTESMYGVIKSEWKRDGDNILFNVIVPPNSSAEITIPTTDRSEIYESGQNIEQAVGVSNISTSDSATKCTLASGTYCFKFKL